MGKYLESSLNHEFQNFALLNPRIAIDAQMFGQGQQSLLGLVSVASTFQTILYQLQFVPDELRLERQYLEIKLVQDLQRAHQVQFTLDSLVFLVHEVQARPEISPNFISLEKESKMGTILGQVHVEIRESFGGVEIFVARLEDQIDAFVVRDFEERCFVIWEGLHQRFAVLDRDYRS